MNLYDAIKKRISIRKYSNQQLDSDILEQIKLTLKNLKPLNPNINVRLELITDTKVVKTTGIGFMGGSIKINAPHCIIGITENKEGCMENIGFMLEQAVLELQDEGISTCWLGTYNKEKIQSICNVKEGEEIAIVITLGYAEKSFYNNGMRKLLSTSKRKDITETCFYKDWGNNINSYILKEPSMKKILFMSSMYPSSNNSQPVRVIIEENKAVFFVKINKKSDCYKIDGGIFMAHFYLSCFEEGLTPTIHIDQAEHKKYNIPEDYMCIGSVRY